MLEPRYPSTGSAAIPSKVENQTAKRVPEFCRPNTRSRIHASSAIPIPSAVQFNRRAEESWAKDCRLRNPEPKTCEKI